ncbi:phage holin, LLH family [Lentilactobacillus sp. TOM.63]|uniref:phage holin, LLH family n=1 Tax=Lentilactobacillus sp. TOM.63 TaxID=3055077 RepID=UPI0025A00168|nr:phage holin, LLH family [Lentilactobacillus sp. TOM.63]MDM7515221.1 phage holin, LLH family [Lentilactobacillus sp. TOM.63]
METFKQITDVFNWLESTGILAALVALILVVVKQVQPYLKLHVKNKQLSQVVQFALTTVTKFATLEGLSKSDRKKAADKDVAGFAAQLGLTWVTPEIVDSIVEAAYQQFKKLGYDNHAPKTSPEPTENSATPQTPESSAEQNAQSSASKPESASQPASQAPQSAQPAVKSGSDQHA